MLQKKHIILAPFLSLADRAYIGDVLGRGQFMHVVNTDVVGWKDIDLVYLPGGADVDPKRYGGDHNQCGPPSPLMERFDRTYLPTAINLEIPIIGICRGAQSLWVELGGKLIEDLPQHPCDMQIIAGLGLHSVYGPWLGDGVNFVNSLHHQGGDPSNPPDGVEIGLIAADGVVEGWTYGDHIVAVQFHPEMMFFDSCNDLIQAALSRSARSLTNPICLDENIHQFLTRGL
jgi:putative glutamine amidotransferase